MDGYCSIYVINNKVCMEFYRTKRDMQLHLIDLNDNVINLTVLKKGKCAITFVNNEMSIIFSINGTVFLLINTFEYSKITDLILSADNKKGIRKYYFTFFDYHWEDLYRYEDMPYLKDIIEFLDI